MKKKWYWLILLILQNNALAANCHLLTSKVIDAPGCYYLEKDWKGFIYIDSDSVILDLNDKNLFPENIDDENVGVFINGHKDIVIKNGYFSHFWIAISGVDVENILVSHNIFLHTKYIAINLSGKNITVKNNRISYLDFFAHKNETDFYIIGMNIRDSSGCVIERNVLYAPNVPVNPLDFKLEYVGLILAEPSSHCRIFGNIFSNFKLPLFESIGFWIGGGEGNELYDNMVINFNDAFICNDGSCIERNNIYFNTPS